MDYSKMKVPCHIAFIVDGNGRWGQKNGLSRSAGHEAGFKNLMRILSYSYSKGIKYFSAYLFSTENFKRSKIEVDFLMGLLTSKLGEILDFCYKQHIKVLFSGRRDRLSAKVLKTMDKIENETKDFDNIFNICFNYGGHAEITDGAKKIVKDVLDGKININDIDDDLFDKYLYQNLPPIDLMIRTSGEQRISNFMLWQCAYAEFYFPKTLFPDFDESEFDKAILEYTKRERRFGGVNYENEGD